ncbi:MAG: hypothetical protein EKK31_22230 [Hyphomicrobiales bacterium]|nr:MAG: hypothetical protein EKK31_22230 [Hyphomicrobiales bacterium]
MAAKLGPRKRGSTTGQTGVGLDQWNFDSDGALVFTGEGHDIARELVREHSQKRPEPSLTIVGPVVTVPGWTGPLWQVDVDGANSRKRHWEAKGF